MEFPKFIDVNIEKPIIGQNVIATNGNLTIHSVYTDRKFFMYIEHTDHYDEIPGVIGWIPRWQYDPMKQIRNENGKDIRDIKKI